MAIIPGEKRLKSWRKSQYLRIVSLRLKIYSCVLNHLNELFRGYWRLTKEKLLFEIGQLDQVENDGLYEIYYVAQLAVFCVHLLFPSC
jgi:hypothetical protein